MRRLLLACAAALLVAQVAAPPAGAHTVTGVRPTNYASRILVVRPQVEGVTVRVLDLGRRMEVRNRTSEDVVVLGYQGEPYLRVGPAGAFENRTSPTTAANRVSATTTSTTAPAITTPPAAAATPSWRRISGADVVRWPDQRTRYEGPKLTGPARSLGTWALTLQHGDRPITVSGVLSFAPGPAPILWVAITVAMAAATAAAAFTKRWGRGLSVALALLLASDVIHSFGTAAATHEPFAAQLVRVLVAGLVTTAAWLVGVAALPALQRNHEGGLVAAGGVGLVVAAFSGVSDLGVFANSQVATVFPAVTARTSVAMALGLGVGLVAASIVVIARDPALRPTVGPSTDGTDR